MVQKSKRRSTSKKQKSNSKQREIDQNKNKQLVRKIKNDQKKVKLTTRQKTIQSKSQTKGNQKEKKNVVAPIKKKITKGKKSQQKKQSIKKETIVQKQQKKNLSLPVNKRKKPIQKQKLEKTKSLKKSIEKKVKNNRSQEKKIVSVNKSQSKKKEKSYFDILYDFICAHDKGLETEPPKVQSEKRPYQLIEDIKIIYAVAQDDKHEGLGPIFWNELANKKIMQRPVESMRDRYKRYIRFLDKNDFDKIISYLRNQGTDGYMIFSKGEDGNKKLLNIQLQDPSIKIDQQQQLIEGIQRPKDHKSLEMFSKMISKKQEIKKQVDEEKCFPIISDQMSSNFKKIAIQAAKPIIKQNSTMLSSTLHEEFPMMKQVQNQAAKSLECIIQTSYTVHTDFQGHRFSTQQKITDIKDLNSVVNMLHFQFNKSRSEIIENLQDVNGNIQSLIQIYQQPIDNAHLRWTPEDDNILQKCKSKDDISLKLLVRYKGEDSVRNRIKFKKFILPFTY